MQLKSKIEHVIGNIDRRTALFWIVSGMGLIAIVGILDFFTGYEFAFSLFYLIPIAVVTWGAGRRFGIVASVVSGLVWLASDIAAGKSLNQPIVLFWNSLIGLSFFIIFTVLLAIIKKALAIERNLAQTDYLTGAVNARFFYALLRMEIDRSQRYATPFTVAYVDIDNFKTVNDLYGHATGDKALQAVVSQCRLHVRKSDVIARLGGDEFALLLPETDLQSAQVVIAKIHDQILLSMKQHEWPATVSIGALACMAAPSNPAELINQVDELMYAVKHSGKNGMRFATYPG